MKAVHIVSTGTAYALSLKALARKSNLLPICQQKTFGLQFDYSKPTLQWAGF
jgi:hypothetical protein